MAFRGSHRQAAAVRRCRTQESYGARFTKRPAGERCCSPFCSGWGTSLRGFVYVAPDFVAGLLVNIGQVVLLAAMLLGIAPDFIGAGAAGLLRTFLVARIRAAEMIISVFSGGWLASFSIYILAGTCAVLLRICRSRLLPGIGAIRLVGIGHWSPPSKSILRRIQSWMRQIRKLRLKRFI